MRGPVTKQLTPVHSAVGEWIWDGGEEKPFHFYLYARRTFDLTDLPQNARLHVTASDRYLVFINGACLGRGPARSDPRRKTYDTYQVAEHLTPGANVIAVRAYHYGTPPRGDGWGGWSGNAYTVGERAGLWAQLDMESADGAVQSIGTDESWRLRPARGWQRELEAPDYLIGAPDIFDATRDPSDWMNLGYDDSDWDPAQRIHHTDIEWFLLEARDIPMLAEKEIFPARLTKVGEVIDLARSRERSVAALLFSEMQLPLELASADNPESLLANDGQAATFQSGYKVGSGIRAPYVIVDFGRQIFGFPRVRLSAGKDAMLDMTYGQHLVNERVPPGVAYGDRYQARAGDQTWEVAEYRQFRYLHLAVRSLETPVTIESISVNEYTYPAEERGLFECSDPVLTKLWRACVDTAYLHIEDTLVCDAHRERVAWSPCACYTDHVALVTYGGVAVLDRFLRAFLLSDRGDGMLQQDYPPEEPRRYNGPTIGLQWSRKVLNYFLHTGNRAVTEELYPSIKRQIDWFEPYRDERGVLDGLPMAMIFDDSAPTDMRGTCGMLSVLYVDGLEAAAELADYFGDAADAERWRSTADEVRSGVQQVFWDETAGRYGDSHHLGELTGIASEHTNGLALRYGIPSAEQVARIAAHFPGDDTDFVAANILAVSPVLDGLLAAGLDQLAIDIIRERYPHILEAADNPTLWECWDPFSGKYPIQSDEELPRSVRLRPKGVRSLVHAGAVFVGYVMSTRIAGIQPTAPGFDECTIRPHVGDLEWARGIMPTPKGDLTVEWRRSDGGLRLTAEIPDGATATVELPGNLVSDPVLIHNGARVDVPEPASTDAASARDEGLVRHRIGAGRHTLELSAARGGG